MSTALTPLAPIINLAVYLAAILAMIGAARWADRAVKRAERLPARAPQPLGWRLTAPGPVAAPAAPRPLAGVPGARLVPARPAFPDLACLLARHERRLPWFLFGLALILRVPFLETLPGTVSATELARAGEALAILDGGGPPLFGRNAAGEPALGVHLLALSWRLFGVTIFAERLVVALLTACAVFPFYALARRAAGLLPAVAATVLFASARWFLGFSRSAWDDGLLVLAALLAAWALVRAFERGRRRDWALAGAALALPLYGPPAGHAVALALLVYLAVALWRTPEAALPGGRRAAVAGAALTVGLCTLLFLPQPAAGSGEAARTARSASPVSILDAPLAPGESVVGVAAGGAWAAFRSFFLLGTDAGTGPYRGAGQGWLDPIGALLFLAGIVLALRQRGFGLWWCLLLIPLAVTQILTAGGPDGARALVAVAPMYLFAALALDALLRRPALRRPQAQAAILGWVAILVALNAGTYAAWVRSPEAAAARGPAVAARDFYLWREYQLDRLATGEGVLGPAEYTALAPSAVAARVAARQGDTPSPATTASAAPPAAPPRELVAREVATVGAPGQEPGRLGLARAVAADGRGILYVADSARGKILAFAPDGTFLTEWGSPETLGRPWAVVVAPEGTVIVLDAETGRLARFGPDGAPLGAPASLGDPTVSRGMALGLDGKIYVAQTAANRVVAVPVAALGAEQGEPAPAADARHAQPTGAVADARGNLFVYEPDGDRLRGYAPGGGVRFTRKAPHADTLNAGGLALLPDGRLALADADGRRVHVYDANGALVGSFPVDAKPLGLAVTPAGHLAVADAEGGRVRLYQIED